jgi:hypothetical protein
MLSLRANRVLAAIEAAIGDGITAMSDAQVLIFIAAVAGDGRVGVDGVGVINVPSPLLSAIATKA